MSVEFGRRLPFTASDASVMQFMPAPVSPSYILLALAAAIAGVDSMTDVYTACNRLHLGFSTQLRDVIVERCVAARDGEGYKYEQKVVHCQSMW
eukprot:4362123-Pleurochrysis_carterae.AAC.2